MFSLLLPLRSQDAILFTAVPLLVLVADVTEGVTGLAVDLDVRHCEVGPKMVYLRKTADFAFTYLFQLPICLPINLLDHLFVYIFIHPKKSACKRT